ncbi:MAG TPA: hypothetical protein VJ951_12720 [Bacteroidales bacterium]|nr:hypothetical protein [Bacteroidales bacterium]
MNEELNSPGKQAKEQEKRMIGILQSRNTSAIINTIKEIREKGRASILPEVFNLLESAEDNEIIGACIELINDLKIEEATPYIINAIKDQSLTDIRQTLVSSCWQNGLDYSNHIELFTDLLIKDDYLVSIEAFTVIENHLDSISDEAMTRITQKLRQASQRASTEKKNLINEMLNVIKEL